MSDTIKRPYGHMRRVADKILERFAPACVRIEAAGSLRRERPQVGDIELVAIPRFERPVMGPQMGWSEVDKLLAEFEAKGGIYIETGKKNRGHERKYVKFSFTIGADRYACDLFLQPDPATWGLNFMVRTGSAEFAQRMVTTKGAGGLKPDGIFIKEARVYRAALFPGAVDELLETPEEDDIFDLWGMDFVPPQERK